MADTKKSSEVPVDIPTADIVRALLGGAVGFFGPKAFRGAVGKVTGSPRWTEERLYRVFPGAQLDARWTQDTLTGGIGAGFGGGYGVFQRENGQPDHLQKRIDKWIPDNQQILKRMLQRQQPVLMDDDPMLNVGELK